MVAQPKPMTVAAFMALPDDGTRREFVRGEVRRMTPVGRRHGRIETALTSAIDHYLDDKARALGWQPEQGILARDQLVGFVLGGEVGLRFTTPDDPDQVRGADGAYVPPEQGARATWDDDGYFPEVPRLVIEVISPTDSDSDVSEKVQDYLAGGAQRVWRVDPKRRRIYIDDVEAPTRVVRWGESLTDDELLPGFVLPLNLIFPAP